MRKAKYPYLERFIEDFWFIPCDALLRAAEAAILSGYDFKRPVLDIGCGDGRVSKLLFLNKGKVDVGIDLDEKEIKYAQSSRVYQKVIVANAEKMPFKDEYFRTVIANSTFEHIRGDTKAVSEVSRVLRPGGRFFLTVPTKRLVGCLQEFGLKGRKLQRFNDRVCHRHYRDFTEWQKILRKYRLEVIHQEYYFPKKLVGLWLRLFQIATWKIYRRELWSYIKDSPYGKLFPRRLIMAFLKFYLRKHFDSVFSGDGAWLFIVAEKTK